MARRIVFRADASPTIGFGHVARIAALIEESVTAGDEPVAMFGGDVQAVASWARDRKLTCAAKAWSADAVVRAADELRARAVVIDGRGLAAELAPRLAARKIKTVVVDDHGGLSLAVDAVVNHNVHAPALAGSYPEARRRLLGRKYLLLRKDIRRLTRGACRPVASDRLRVVVTFGGSDPVNATTRALSALPDDQPLDLVAIAGPGFQHDAELAAAAAAARGRGHDVEIRRAPDDPGALFVTADAAISAAGGTLGEFAYLGVPAIAYAIVGDQVAPARELARMGAIAGGGAWQDLDDATLRQELAAFLGDDVR